MNSCDMLEELNVRQENESTGWIVAWDRPPHFGLWSCALIEDCHPSTDERWGTTVKVFTGTDVKECVRKAWESEKEAEVRERTELQRLREMYGMVRDAGEKAQTSEEIRAELAKLRGLFDMEKEAGE